MWSIYYKQKKNSSFIYQNDLDRACFQHDTVYGKYKDLTKRTESDKVLKDKGFSFNGLQVFSQKM